VPPLSQVLVTFLMVTLTAMVQLVMQLLIGMLTPPQSWSHASTSARRVIVTIIAIGVLMTGLLVEVSIWAVQYWAWGELGDFPSAFYFSLATFTTLGANELELSRAHRMVGAVESAIGMLVFGWSTALLVSLIQRHEQLRHEHKQRRAHANGEPK